MAETEHLAVNGQQRRDRSGGGRAIAAERRIQALELRKRGLGFREIARQLGVSLGQAHGDVQKAMSALADMELKCAEDAHRLDLERIDGLIEGHYQQAVSGDHRSAAIILRVLERRAKLLGLDAPDRDGGRSNDLELYLRSKYGVELGAPTRIDRPHPR